MGVVSGRVSGRSSKNFSGLGDNGNVSSSAHKGSDKGRESGDNQGRE